MLNKLELHNFKSHHYTQLNFDDSRLQAIVGRNSSGKTSVLQSIYYFGQLTNARFKDVFISQQTPSFIATFGKDETLVMVSGSQSSINWQASYGFNKKSDNSWSPIAGWEYNSYLGDIRNDWLLSLKDTNEKEILDTFDRVIYLKLLSNNLAKASYSEEVVPEIQFDGSGLAPTLDYLRSEAPDRFQSIQEMLQQIVPGVRKVGVRRAKVKIDRQRSIAVDGKSIAYEESQEVTGQEIILDMNTGDLIPAHAISEGTMLTLGLLTVLMNPKQPNLVLLDDIEQGLHPKAQRELITVFKQII
jgi:predicted ATPase